MINSKKELEFYMMADHMMNRGKFTRSFKDRLKELLYPDKIMRYLRLMRKTSYYRSRNSLIGYYYSIRFNRIGQKLGFTISPNVFGYGLTIQHYGTIVVGGGNIVGNYAVLQTSICISGNKKHIGDALYVSTGAKITSGRELGNNVSIAANSVVSKSFPSSDNILLAGVPASVKSDSKPWYIRDGEKWEGRVRKCEELRRKMNLK